MGPGLFFSVCCDRHAVLASQQSDLCMLSFSTASWEELVKLGIDNGTYHNYRTKSYHCFLGPSPLRGRGVLNEGPPSRWEGFSPFLKRLSEVFF